MPMEHDEAEMLLPFLANGSLGDDERLLVESHARGCLLCHKALTAERALVQAFRVSLMPEQIAADTFDQVLARVRRPQYSTHRSHRRDLSSARRWQSPALRFALAAALVLALGVAWQSGTLNSEQASFRTLSRAGHSIVGTETVYVVFEPAVPVATINALLHAVGGELVAGPNSVGAYTLRVAGSVTSTIAALTAAPEVKFVAPAVDGAAADTSVEAP